SPSVVSYYNTRIGKYKFIIRAKNSNELKEKINKFQKAVNSRSIRLDIDIDPL
ncbi:hypothetical protein MCHI_002614, partial [Candidatus Magnetoovum chiemensis]